MTNEEIGQRIARTGERLNIFVNVVEKYITRNGNNGSGKSS